ncbi:MAG: hypothetical protein QM778_14060 [Myxococcales bacterium]
MSLRTIQRLGFVSSLAVLSLGLVACGGDDDKKETNGGDGDGDAAAPADSGTHDSGTMLTAEQVKCGETVCNGVKLLAPPNIKACCLPDNTCGLESTRLTGENLPACVARDAVGVASDSCGAVWDKVDFADETGKADAGPADDQTDGKFTRKVSAAPPIVTNFAGCCTSAGVCSIDFKTVDVVVSGNKIPGATDIGYGCPDPAYVGLAAASVPAGFGDTITCDPTSGMVTEQPAAPAQP